MNKRFWLGFIVIAEAIFDLVYTRTQDQDKL